MKFSSLVDRIDADGGDGWAVQFAAWQAHARGEDVIILSIGDPDFPTPEPIVDAAVNALRAGDTHYTDMVGRDAVRELVAARFTASTGVEWRAENVMMTAGTQGALFATSLCLLETGDEVIALDPMYLTYEATFRAGGADLVSVVQDGSAGFPIDADRVAAAVTGRTRAIALTTPNNPTGSVASRGELEGIADLARRHDLWVIADEVYADLIFEGEHISIASLDGMSERTVTVSSLSKSHAMTGWRVGWAIAPEALVDHYSRLGLAMQYGLPGFVQEAAIEALANQDAAVAAMREIYRRRRDLVCEELGRADGLTVLSPTAGMYVMVDVRASGKSSKDFAWALFRGTGVSVVDAGSFGQAGEGWIRIAFTIGEDELREGCRRIVKFVGDLAEASD